MRLESLKPPAPGEDRMPTYGPNGTWVYFSSNRWGSWDILRTRSDGTGPIEQVTHDDVIDEFEPSISPDGEWMAYARSVPGSTDGYRIWIRNLVDGRDIDLQTPGRHPAWDPAGNRIAFQHRPQADGPLWSIFTLELDAKGRTGALAQVVAPTDDGYGAIAPSWSPDGLNLAFLRARSAGGPLSGIWTVAANGGRPVEIHVDQADSFWSMAWGSTRGSMLLDAGLERQVCTPSANHKEIRLSLLEKTQKDEIGLKGSDEPIEPFFGVGVTSTNRQDAMTTVRIQMAVLCSVLTLLGCHRSLMQNQQRQPLGVAVQPVRNESGWGGFEGDRATDMVVERLSNGGSLFVPPLIESVPRWLTWEWIGPEHQLNLIGWPMPWVFNAS